MNAIGDVVGLCSERLKARLAERCSFLYPLVTKVAFEGFPCYSFDEGRLGFLMSDVSIECGTAEHHRVQIVAWLAVVAYPIGITLFCMTLLFKAAPALIAGKKTPLTRSIRFLYAEYTRECFWCEP